MFYYLQGTVAHIEANLAVIDCGGVGYAVHSSARSIAGIKAGELAKLFTYVHVREDAFEIFGFISQSELNTFRQLISVGGVGNRMALALLSGLSPEDLAISIIGGDEKMLTRTPGIGKKLAQRIILELKDKIDKELSETGGMESFGMSVSASDGGKLKEVTAALAVLGFTPTEVSGAMKNLPSGLLEHGNVSEIVRQVLKNSVK
jgi:Holliday junction DNA helicase RuvA